MLVECVEGWYDGCRCVVFFFSSRRRHTRFDCDWSSDVCSSDLAPAMVRPQDGDTSPAAPPGWGVGVRAEVHGSRHGREGGIGLNPIAALTRRKRSGESKGGCTDLILRHETGRLLTS